MKTTSGRKKHARGKNVLFSTLVSSNNDYRFENMKRQVNGLYYEKLNNKNGRVIVEKETIHVYLYCMCWAQ